jgi:hypothetical protein
MYSDLTMYSAHLILIISDFCKKILDHNSHSGDISLFPNMSLKDEFHLKVSSL